MLLDKEMARFPSRNTLLIYKIFLFCFSSVDAVSNEHYLLDIIMIGFAVFIVFVILFHFYLRRQQRRRIEDNIMTSTFNHINAKGMVIEISNSYEL